MATQKAQERALQIRARIERIRQEIAELETLSSGTVLTRMKTCGNPSCACHQDPGKRHGPYYEWTHLKAGKYTHRSLSVEQAAATKAAIANHLLRGQPKPEVMVPAIAQLLLVGRIAFHIRLICQT